MTADTLRTIRLYGTLGAKYGRSFNLAVASCAEAVQALCAMLPGFERDMMTAKDTGVGFACFYGKRNLSADNLCDPPGAEDIRIAPMPFGAKRGGLATVLLGAVVVAAAITMGPAAAGVGSFLGVGGAYATAAQLGVGLMLSGAMQALTPVTKGLATKDSANNGASYNYNGPVNTTAQGGAVGLCYGEMIVGSATISAGIYAEDQQ